MYPETDIPQIRIEPAFLEELKTRLPELLGDKKERIRQDYGLGEETVKQLVKAGKAHLFEQIVQAGGDRKTAAFVLAVGLKDLKTREKVPIEQITDGHLLKLFTALGSAPVAKEALLQLLKQIAEKPDADIGNLVEGIKGGGVSEEEMRAQISRIVSENKGLSFGALMGIVMQQLRGKADGKLVAQLITEELKKSGGI
jgi:glutamyl-tRNA(Gln) amidotransferase subunit E